LHSSIFPRGRSLTHLGYLRFVALVTPGVYSLRYWREGAGSVPFRVSLRFAGFRFYTIHIVKSGTAYLIHGYQRPVLPIPGKALYALSPSADDVAIGRFVNAEPRRGGHLRTMGDYFSSRRRIERAHRDRVVLGVEVGSPREGFGRDVVVIGCVHLGKVSTWNERSKLLGVVCSKRCVQVHDQGG
jgi:hypothetical protein